MADGYHRRLAAVLAADVVGYSRLMDEDEIRTFTRLKNVLRAVVEPAIRRNGGVLVNTFGDGLLAEFVSVIDGVTCAIEIQTCLADAERETPEESRFTFRIGVNLGDVIHDDDDIFGDGVNIAARLQTLAQPGEICVSGAVRDAVRGKLDVEFVDRGEQPVKNISGSVRVYAVRFEPGRWLPPGVPAAVEEPRRSRARATPVLLGISGLLAIAVGFGAMRYASLLGTRPLPAPSVAASSAPRPVVKATALPVRTAIVPAPPRPAVVHTALPVLAPVVVTRAVASPTADALGGDSAPSEAVGPAKLRPAIPIDANAVTAASTTGEAPGTPAATVPAATATMP